MLPVMLFTVFFNSCIHGPAPILLPKPRQTLVMAEGLMVQLCRSFSKKQPGTQFQSLPHMTHVVDTVHGHSGKG